MCVCVCGCVHVCSLIQEKIKLEQSLEELEERFRPFYDQIDGLEGMNLLLQNQTSLAQSEVQKLSEQYARLLGHQNQKQKIQHVKKLKDENASLKQVCNAETEPILTHLGSYMKGRNTVVSNTSVVGWLACYCWGAWHYCLYSCIIIIR